MKHTLKKAFNIEEEEIKPVGLLLAHSFFIGMFVAFYFSYANGSFLTHFKPSALPYAYIISGVAGFIVSSIFSRLQKKIAYSKLIMIVLIFILALMIFFRFCLFGVSNENTSLEPTFDILLGLGPALSYRELISFIIFIWIAPVLGLIALQYWGMALRLFDLRQSKRLFGIIGSGDVISSIIGFFSVPLFLKLLGSKADLLWLSAIVIGLSMIFQSMLIKHFPNQLSIKSAKKKKVKGNISSIFKSPYFKTIFIVTIISVIAQHFVDFTYMGIVKSTFPKEQLTSFIGMFFGVIKVVELLAKTVIVGKLLNQYGLKLGLLALASLIGIFTFMAAMIGTFAGIAASLFFLPLAMNKLFDLSGRKSIEEPSFKVLYQPLDAETKMIVQTQAEGKAKQIGKMSAGIILLILSSFEFFNELIAIYILCGIVIIWLIMSSKLYSEYRNTVKNALASKEKSQKLNPIFSSELIEASLQTEDITKLSRAIAIGSQLDITFSNETIKKLIIHPSDKVRGITAQYIQKHITPSLLPTLEKQCSQEGNDTLIQYWKNAISIIKSLQSLTINDILRLVKSLQTEERKLAVLWLKFYQHPNEVELTRELIGDRSIEIAEMAIRINQRVKNDVLFLFLTELLHNADYSQEIIETLSEATNVLTYQKLENLFRRHERQPVILVKIVQIGRQLQTSDAINFFVDKINYPDRSLQLVIIKILANSYFQAHSEHKRLIIEKIKSEVTFASWLVRSILDLSKDDNFNELIYALTKQLNQLEELVFSLLSFIYDPIAIQRIKENLEKGTKEGIALALEMADILLEDEVKYYVRPILNRGSLEEKSSTLAEIKPEPKLKAKNRLKNILLKDFSKVTPWLKALALNKLGDISNKLSDEISSYAFHKNKLLKETALIAIHNINPPTYDYYSSKERRKEKFTFDKVTGFLKDYPKEISILEEVKLLKGLPFFRNVPEEILAEIAILTDEEIILSGKRQVSYSFKLEDTIQIIIEGNAIMKTPTQELKITKGTVIGLAEKIDAENSIFEAASTTRILYLPSNQFFELAFIFSELTEAIFEYLSITTPKENTNSYEATTIEDLVLSDL